MSSPMSNNTGAGNMGAFALGLLGVRLVWALAVLALGAAERSIYGPEILLGACALVLVPVGAGWFAAGVVARRRQIKLCAPGATRRTMVAKCAWGLASGAAGIGLSVLLVPLLARWRLDWYADAIVTPLVCLGAVLLMARVKAGACFACDYPLNGSSVCPECGGAVATDSPNTHPRATPTRPALNRALPALRDGHAAA